MDEGNEKYNVLDQLGEIGSLSEGLTSEEKDAFRRELLRGRADYLRSALERARGGAAQQNQAQEQAALQGQYEREVRAPNLTRDQRLFIRDKYRGLGLLSLGGQPKQPEQPKEQPSREELLEAYRAEMRRAEAGLVSKLHVRGKFRALGLSDDDMRGG